MRLRGFDEYEVTLGDEMRGERASMGKTLADAEHDLRIKAIVIRAIEDCDLDGFPNDSVIPGYVRSYSRYLGMDPEACLRRFCAESGFRSPVMALGGNGVVNGLSKGVAAVAAAGAGLAHSRFAMPPAPARLGARVNLGGLTSALALVGLITGLAYGGYALLQDIQRVGFAPLPEAPDIMTEAPMINLTQLGAQPGAGLLRRPDADAYQGDGVLATFAPAELAPPSLPARDGPISAIDPSTSGVFAALAHEPAPDQSPALAAAPDHHPPKTPPPAAQPANAGPPQVAVQATESAWIRVGDGEEVVIFEGILGPGERFEIPARAAAPILRAGNAGAVFVLIGSATYGPVGDPGRVVKNISLRAADIEVKMPQASAEAAGLPAAETTVLRAEAVLGQ